MMMTMLVLAGLLAFLFIVVSLSRPKPKPKREFEFRVLTNDQGSYRAQKRLGPGYAWADIDKQRMFYPSREVAQRVIADERRYAARLYGEWREDGPYETDKTDKAD